MIHLVSKFVGYLYWHSENNSDDQRTKQDRQKNNNDNLKKNSAATTKVLYPGLFMICPIDGDTSTIIVMLVETAPGYSFGSRKI